MCQCVCLYMCFLCFFLDSFVLFYFILLLFLEVGRNWKGLWKQKRIIRIYCMKKLILNKRRIRIYSTENVENNEPLDILREDDLVESLWKRVSRFFFFHLGFIYFLIYYV